jgi:hypothetical protein
MAIDIHPYGAAQHRRFRQHIPRGLSERSRDPVYRGRGEGSIKVKNQKENQPNKRKENIYYLVKTSFKSLVFI